MCVVTERVHRVRHSAPMKFLFVDLAPVLSGKGEAQQTDPDARGCGRELRFKRGLCRGNKKQPVQPEFLPSGVCHEQMAQVDGVKRAAKKPDAGWVGGRVHGGYFSSNGALPGTALQWRQDTLAAVRREGTARC